MLPKKGRVIGTKKSRRVEQVGIDDTITKIVNIIMFIPDNELIVQFYDEELKEYIGEITLKQILDALPLNDRMKRLEELVGKEEYLKILERLKE